MEKHIPIRKLPQTVSLHGLGRKFMFSFFKERICSLIHSQRKLIWKYSSLKRKNKQSHAYNVASLKQYMEKNINCLCWYIEWNISHYLLIKGRKLHCKNWNLYLFFMQYICLLKDDVFIFSHWAKSNIHKKSLSLTLKLFI